MAVAVAGLVVVAAVVVVEIVVAVVETVVAVVVVGVVGTPPYQLRLLQTLLRSHPFCSVFAVLSLCPTTDRYKKLFVDLASSSFQSPGLTSGVGSGGGK